MTTRDPWRRVRLPLTESTQEDALELAREGAPEGLVVRADVQATGRGRLGRGWASPRGGLWFSAVLRPERSGWGLLPLLAGSAVAAALRKHGVDAQVKWPNDVLVAGRKVCGVLLEGHAGREPFVVLGVGINANVDVADLPGDARGRATTLRAELGRDVDLEALWDDVLGALWARYRQWRDGGDGEVLEEWRLLTNTLGARVRVAEAGVAGRAVDVAADGALVVEDARGERVRVTAGDLVEWEGAEDGAPGSAAAGDAQRE